MTLTTRKTKPPQKTAVIWTTSDNRDGIKAASLLRNCGAKVEVREIDSGKWKKSDVAAAVPGYTTLPQVVVDNAVVGDLAALKAHPAFLPRLKKPQIEQAAKVAKGAADLAKYKTDRAAAVAARVVAAKSKVIGRKAVVAPINAETQAAVAAAITQAKADRAEHAAARIAAVKAARPAKG